MYYFCNKRTAIKYVQTIWDSSPAWFILVEEFVKDGTGFMYSPFKKKTFTGNSLTVQWLGLYTFTAEGSGSVPGRGTKIPASRTARPKNKIKLN